MPKGVRDLDYMHRCTARKSNGAGERCKNAAIKGGTVCRFHGGAAKHVQAKARERFNDLIDPMINIAHELTREAQEGRLSASDRISLLKFIADRTGFIPGKTVEIETPKWEGVMTHVIRQLPDNDPTFALPAADEPDVLDGEVIEDDDPEDMAPVRHMFPASQPRRSADPPAHLA